MYALCISVCHLTAQERTEERLYEEELEVVWDKGSSGLVFYTDANYWDEQDGGLLWTVCRWCGH